LLIWVVVGALLLYAIFGYGWTEGWVVAGTFLAVSIVAGATFIPKPESVHYIKKIYRSMVNRHADYEKLGDTVRSDAMKDLINRVEQTFGDKLP
jgi:hypothetical protein